MAKWSPDGSRIVFVSNRDGGFKLYVMSGEGTDVRPVER
jgi:Tol biopolymer transport system component